jgi:ABC-type Zn uptake system ZnuABC Zn-binding protein ZnuA
MLAAALQKINAKKPAKLKIAVVHDGYAYLLGELGIEVTAVIQPRHGIEPSPRQLQDTIKRIQQANVNVLFAESGINRIVIFDGSAQMFCNLEKIGELFGETTLAVLNRQQRETP